MLGLNSIECVLFVVKLLQIISFQSCDLNTRKSRAGDNIIITRGGGGGLYQVHINVVISYENQISPKYHNFIAPHNLGNFPPRSPPDENSQKVTHDNNNKNMVTANHLTTVHLHQEVPQEKDPKLYMRYMCIATLWNDLIGLSVVTTRVMMNHIY